MATDSINIGGSPAGEPCIQTGYPDHHKWQRLECDVLRRQLVREYGDVPEHCKLVIKGNPHEFGAYYELDCVFDPTSVEAVEYAFECENLPEEWDTIAREELTAAGYPFEDAK
jgi:hypothetical protein